MFQRYWLRQTYQDLEHVVWRLANDVDPVHFDHLVARVDEARTVRRPAVHHARDHDLARLLVRLDRGSLRNANSSASL